MSETAMSAIKPQQFRAEAEEHCREHGITDIDGMERVRMSMVHREFVKRMKPWIDLFASSLVNFLPGAPFEEALKLGQSRLSELQRMHALELGIELEEPNEENPPPPR